MTLIAATDRGGLRRLFFALWPGEATRQQLVRQSRRAVRHCGGRPVPPENLHITLAFLGNVPETAVDSLVDAARTLNPEPFTLTLEKIAYWPKPRVLWAAPASPPAELLQLEADLWACLANLGHRREARAYQPHVTLCRKVGRVVEKSLDRPVSWHNHGFVLAESKTLPAGAMYRVVAQFPPAGSPGEP